MLIIFGSVIKLALTLFSYQKYSCLIFIACKILESRCGMVQLSDCQYKRLCLLFGSSVSGIDSLAIVGPTVTGGNAS